MDKPGGEPLSGAGLPLEQYRAFSGGHGPDFIKHGFHGLAFGLEQVELPLLPDLLPEVVEFRFRPVLFRDTVDHQLNLIGNNGVGEVGIRPFIDDPDSILEPFGGTMTMIPELGQTSPRVWNTAFKLLSAAACSRMSISTKINSLRWCPSCWRASVMVWLMPMSNADFRISFADVRRALFLRIKCSFIIPVYRFQANGALGCKSLLENRIYCSAFAITIGWAEKFGKSI